MKKNKKRKEEKLISFTDFMLRVVNELNAEERFSMAHVYFYALQAYKQFIGGGKIFFGSINRSSLKRFELMVTVTAETLTLIDRYRSVDPKSPYLLRFFDGITGARAIYEEYCRQLRLLNSRLMRLAKILGLSGIKLSSYTARHTWATTAKYCMGTRNCNFRRIGTFIARSDPHLSEKF